MRQAQQSFSEWTKTNSSSTKPVKAYQWNQHEGFLWKAAILLGLTYIVWTDKLSFTILIGNEISTERPEAAVACSLFDEMPSLQVKSERNRATKVVRTAHSDVTSSKKSVRTDMEDSDTEYIRRFAPVAKAEMRKFGIPASIILAQAMVESKFGTSGLATKANNHFGIKCFSQKCKKGHCLNYADDTHKDFFVKYPNAWSSFRAHSTFLAESDRYRRLFTSHNYAVWANGLKKAGYATDPQYAQKLIELIRRYQLNRFDRDI